jgi:TRAP-type C4-dicarboxylate transport system permease small subunit
MPHPLPAVTAGALFRWACTGLNVAGTALVLVLVTIITCDSLARTFFARPILGVPEFVELSLVAIVFLQLADAVRAGRITRSEGMLNLLADRLPRVRAGLSAVFDLLGAAFMALIVAGGIPRFFQAWHGSEFKGTAHLFTIPTWPVRLIIVIGATAAAIAFLVLAWQHLQRMMRESGGGASRA